jgi:thymidylate synthase (FAD)
MSNQIKYKCYNCGRSGKISKEIFFRKQTPFCRGCISTNIIAVDEYNSIWRIKDMKVELVSITKPMVSGLDTAEDLIVYCARVSNPNNQLNVDTGAKLLKYCIKHGHWSIFEQVDMTVEIKTSRAIAAQILRHKTFSFQEFSQRYAEIQEFEDIELRMQGKTNRQVGDEVVNPELEHEGLASNVIDDHVKYSKALYNSLIEAGVARECARMVLPLNVQTTLYMKGNVRSWIHYLQLRTKEDTQKEHRLVAEQIKYIFQKEFPIIADAIEL